MNRARPEMNLSMKLAILFLTFLISAASAAPLKIALVGDSTVCNYPPGSIRHGWGQMLPEFLAPGVLVINEAISGMSTKTFPPAAWHKVLEAKPDYVLIQFGHNDSHNGRPEATRAATDYKENLRRYVDEARAAGLKPVLVTPPHRRVFRNGSLSRKLAPYADAMKAVSAEMSVPVVDLYASSGALFERLGEKGSEALTMNDLDRGGKAGSDRTHFTESGGREMARLVAKDLARVDPVLKSQVRPGPAFRTMEFSGPDFEGGHNEGPR